jgi:hypothetical protein
MVAPGNTVLFRHIEAAETVKVRPAVVLRVIGGWALLVVGQTDEPRGASLLIGGRMTQLRHATYFDCRTVLAISLARIERRLGRVTRAHYDEVVRLCGPALADAVRRVSEEADLQRRRLAEAIGRHAETHECSLEEIADQAKIARLHLRNVVSGDAPWTRDEIVRIAQVLEVDAATLLEGEHPNPPDD